MKIKKILIALIAVTYVCPLSVEADTYCDSIDYVLCGDNAVITGFESLSETIEIPGTIDGKTVSEIRENAFYKCDTLKKIIIPQTVKKIGHHAFYQCTALETAEIKGEISQIGEGSFYGCTSLIEVKFPNSLKRIEKYSFYGCENLERMEFPSGLMEIGEYAFAECTSLSYTRLPDNLVDIEQFAFYECKSLKNINIPDNVMNMGNYSIGFGGNDPEPIEDFCILGDDDSLGKIYAEANCLKFENINDGQKQEKKKISPIPAAAAISSTAGLMFFRFLEKLKLFRKKYEYEC